MNGKKAKRLRSMFGPKTARYKGAKQQYRDYPTLFAQGLNPVDPTKAKIKLAPERARKNLLTGAKPQPRASSAWKRSGPLIVVHPRRMTAKDQRRLTSAPEKVDRELWGAYPKHFVDSIALQYPVERA